MSMCKPVAQSKADDSAHDRTSVVHRRAGDRQERRERQEYNTVHSPCKPQDINGQAPFAQSPWTRRWGATFEPSDNDKQSWE
jgi:hypothetical protein